jgi:hypothetical protein
MGMRDMGTINFDKSFSDHEKRILTKAFKHAHTKLGSDDRDFRVDVERSIISLDPGKYGAVGEPKPGHFIVKLNEVGFNLFDATSCMIHECTHVHQHLVGDLVDDTKEGGRFWKGDYIPQGIAENKLFYKYLPYEREAWKFQAAEHRPFVEGLPEEDRVHVRPEDSHGLVRFWDESLKRAA